MITPTCGVYRFAELRRQFSRFQIDSLVASGRLTRLRRGWYARADLDPSVARAVRLGGTLSCLSALRHYGVWVPPTSQLHLRISEHHLSDLGRRDDVKVCRRPGRAAPSVAIDPLDAALVAAMGCLDDEGRVVVFDSILNLGLMTLDELSLVLSDCPAGVRRLLAEVDLNAQSGIESMARFRLRRAGVKVQTQVPITGVGIVDLLVGDRLVIETDGREFHSSGADFANDRRRDLALVAGGHLVLRLTYQQVVYGWAEVYPHIVRLLRADSHHWRYRDLTAQTG